MRSSELTLQKLAQRLSLATFMAAALSSCLTPPSVMQQSDTAGGPGLTPSSNANFIVNSIGAGEAPTIALNSWGLPKKRLVSMSACLQDALNLGPIQQQPFAVSDGISSRTIESDLRGCLIWTESHEFDYLAPETFVEMQRTITSKGPYKGSVTVTLAYDPWRDGGGSVVDLRMNSVPAFEPSMRPLAFDGAVKTSGSSAITLPTQSRAKGSPDEAAALQLGSIGFTFNGLNYSAYEVDRDLNLTVAHDYTVKLSPSILRKTLGGPSSATPQTGKIRVTFAVATEQKDLDKAPSASDILLAETRVADINMGAVTENFTIKLPDFARLSARSTIYVELEPIVESPSVKAKSFAGLINPIMSSASSNLLPSQVSASSLYSEYRDLQEKRKNEINKLSPFDEFRTVLSLNNLDAWAFSSEADPSKTYAPTRGELALLMANTLPAAQKQVLERKLCLMVYQSSPDAAKYRTQFQNDLTVRGYTTLTDPGARLGWFRPSMESPLSGCLRHPEQFLTVSVRDFAEQILNAVPARDRAVQSLSIAVNASTTISDSSSTGSGRTTAFKWGWNVGASGLSIGTPTVAGVGATLSASASFGQDFYKSWSHARSTGSSASVTASRGYTLSAEANTFTIDLMARRCTLIAPKSDAKELTFAPISYCQGPLVHKEQKETYYLVSQTSAVSGSPFSDALDLRDAPYRMLVRGEQVFELFKRIAGDPNMEIVYEREPEIQKDIAPALPDMHLTQEAPGLLSLE